MTQLSRNPLRSMRRTNSMSPLSRFLRGEFPFEMEITETVPALNIKEEKDSFKVELAAPGLKKDDFNIDVDGNLVTISSEKEEKKEDKEQEGYSVTEYNYSSFSRSFTLPENADTDKMSARYADGILNLTVPKIPEDKNNKRQKIKVE
jgi:HSP20 family protein